MQCNLVTPLEMEVEKLFGFNTEAVGQHQNGTKCWAAFAPLDATNLAQGQTASIGKFFLSKFLRKAKLFQVSTEGGYVFLISILAHSGETQEIELALLEPIGSIYVFK